MKRPTSRLASAASVVLPQPQIRPTRLWLVLATLVSVAGLAVSLVYVDADHRLHLAGLSDVQEIQQARRWLSHSPELAASETQILMLKAMTSGLPADQAAALAVAEQTVQLDK